MTETQHIGFRSDIVSSQKPIEFGKEIQQLTQADRDEIAAGLVANGLDLDMSTVAKN